YLIVFSLMLQVVWAQAPQENNYRFKKAKQVDSVHVDPMEFKTKLFPSMIVPAVLIGWGISTIKSNGIYSSYKAKDDVQRAFPNQGSHIDNYLQFSPYAEFAALIFLKIKCRNDMINTT